ncbi:MAG: Cas10/Cmr2 second palm domain-containing protein [Pseudonocardiaceae bacterium]
MAAQVPPRDLVVIALPGVQRLISEARSTSDVRAGSEIVGRLATVAAASCEQAGELVIPREIGDPDGMPNRVVVLVPTGSGTLVAQEATVAVQREWQTLLGKVFPRSAAPRTPGMPNVQWVCVPDDGRGYGWQWSQAQSLLSARRRVRDFEPQEWTERSVCGLSPRWPAEDVPPPNLKDHEKATLSATNWVKRRWRHLQGRDGFPSTPSIASAPFRHRLLMMAAQDDISTALTALHGAVQAVGAAGESPIAGLPPGTTPVTRWFSRSGGPWVYPERWQPRSLAGDTGREAADLRAAVWDGRAALKRLIELADQHGVRHPTDYLAVVVQDLDGMGRFLGGVGMNAAQATIPVDPDEHRSVSGRLGRLAAGQRQELRTADLLGVPVYVGGDDLLAFTPASTALAAAQVCHDLIPPELPTASTAVLFFHYQTGLQTALTQARELLETAKKTVRGKHALAVGYLRRSGVADCSVQPWSGADGNSAATLFAVFGRDAAHPLSPRLVTDLARDATELTGLYSRDQALHRAELTRLVRRHLGGDISGHETAATEVTTALLALGAGRGAGGGAADSASAAQVGVFLRQEAR